MGLLEWLESLTARTTLRNVHVYDKTRRFRHSDATICRRVIGRRLMSELLHVERVPRKGLLYDLSFSDSGIGAVDFMHATLPCPTAKADEIVAALGLRVPEDSRLLLPERREDFQWLLKYREDSGVSLRQGVAAFVNREKREFQPAMSETDRVWFRTESDVNSWMVLWEHDGMLSLMGYDQG